VFGCDDWCFGSFSGEVCEASAGWIPYVNVYEVDFVFFDYVFEMLDLRWIVFVFDWESGDCDFFVFQVCSEFVEAFIWA